MAGSITRRQIDEGRDVAPTPVKKTVPVKTTLPNVGSGIQTGPVVPVGFGAPGPAPQPHPVTPTPPKTGGGIQTGPVVPVGFGAVGPAPQPRPVTPTPPKTGIGIHMGTTTTIGLGAEAAVYNVAPNDKSAKNLLYANTRKDFDDPLSIGFGAAGGNTVRSQPTSSNNNPIYIGPGQPPVGFGAAGQSSASPILFPPFGPGIQSVVITTYGTEGTFAYHNRYHNAIDLVPANAYSGEIDASRCPLWTGQDRNPCLFMQLQQAHSTVQVRLKCKSILMILMITNTCIPM